ncbi:MAG: hypothetical protein ACK2U9_06180 [Anaerolineae bacterium]
MRAHHLSLFVAMFTVTGCGGGSSEPTDCRAPDRDCDAPFVCREADSAPHDYLCLSPVGDLPTCTGTPAGQVVPFALEPGTDIPLHWTTAGGPVAVTYSPDLDPTGLDPQVLDGTWDADACAFDLLGQVQVAEDTVDPLRTERRIHIQLAELDSAAAMTTTYYEQGTGRIVSAVIDIDPDGIAQLGTGDLLLLLGQAVGLAEAPAGTDSVMVFQSGRDTLSALDIEAFCALYPAAGSRCGD